MNRSMATEVQLTVKVVPNSSRTEIVGRHGGMLKIKIAAVAEKGKANKALAAFLAKQLGIRKNDIQITSGLTSSVKQLRLEGVTENDVETLWT